jgi:acetoin utilization protein AcuB
MLHASKEVMSTGTNADRVSSRMKHCFIHVDPNHSVQQVLQLARFARIRHILVLDHGLLVGTVSHRDLADEDTLAACAERGDVELPSIPVARIMRAPAGTVTPEDSLETAALVMHRQGVGCLPVVACPGSLQVIGLITESDLLAAAYCTIVTARAEPAEGQRAIERAA